jgi:fumarate hydratase class II
MNSGPIAGFGEISIPELQAGSSIMPGKTNPVICEATMMVCAQVVGNDTAVTIGSQSGSFELNTMLPLIAHNILQSIAILANSVRSLSDKVIAGLTVNAKHISRIIELNPILVTALNPIIGYEKGAQIAKKAYAEKRPIKEIAAEMTNLTKEELDSLLDPMTLTKGGNVTYHNRTKHIP